MKHNIACQAKLFAANEQGSAAVEYSVIAGAMFLAISPAFYIVRDGIWDKFNQVATYLNG